MITATFEYLRAGSVDEALDMLRRHGDDAKLLAGGHSLLPMMKLRLARPEFLIDLGGLEELRYIRRDGDMLAIGALTTHDMVSTADLSRSDAPLLAHSASQVGDPQVRHLGTLGGSLVHADPAADLPMAVVACSAVMVAQGEQGRREIAADDFFSSPFETALREDEILVEIRIPRRAGIGWGYEKFTRRANDWAIVAAATLGGRIVLANMGGRPLRALAAETALAAGASAREAAALAPEGMEPADDMHADAEYRRHLARILVGRALEQARG
ncbi:carbon-monoxide dehydrogenase medium subunit [Nakamurella sp. UYEF19]|uniref:xanthine dehydrogenase family protein subunit M n=1 Tax=Nakamurella sp. UYEF19 TaxID=1756392 RepID=UPI0033971516